MVKIKLDSKCDLADIGFVIPTPRYKVRALVVDGMSPALIALATLGDTQAGRAIRKGITLSGQTDKKSISALRCISVDKKGRGIFEIAQRGGGNVRLFFFHLESTETVVVCLNAFWKKGRSKRERADQDAAFDEAAQLMKDYKTWRKMHPTKL